MNISHQPLRKLIAAIFSAAGCQDDEPRQVSDSLVESNLVGHDSHGVIRVPTYVQWLREGKVFANRQPRVVFDHATLAVLDGQLGFGQVIARQAMQLAIDKAAEHGVGIVGLRNSAHVGRVGEWAAQAADAGKIALCFVNTSGRGVLTAPFGGIDRRLSATPIAAAIPVEGRTPIVLDISASSIAEGKVRVALNKGEPAPDGCLIDAEGRPTNDPKVFYADPPGAILPVGGHKGFGLGMVAEILAGALTGGGCSAPGVKTLEQGMLSIVMDPQQFSTKDTFAGEVRRYIDWVKTSRTVTPGGEILMPGEPEQRTRAQRLADGLNLDSTTWAQLTETARSVGLSDGDVESLAGGA